MNLESPIYSAIARQLEAELERTDSMTGARVARHAAIMNIPETVLAAMSQTNELFSSEVVGRQNTDALDRIYTTNAQILPPGRRNY